MHVHVFGIAARRQRLLPVGEHPGQARKGDSKGQVEAEPRGNRIDGNARLGLENQPVDGPGIEIDATALLGVFPEIVGAHQPGEAVADITLEAKLLHPLLVVFLVEVIEIETRIGLAVLVLGVLRVVGAVGGNRAVPHSSRVSSKSAMLSMSSNPAPSSLGPRVAEEDGRA